MRHAVVLTHCVRAGRRWRLAGLLAAMALCGCDRSDTVFVGDPTPAEAARALREKTKLYEGHTLDEWRARIPLLDFRSPERADAVAGLRAIIRDDDAPWFTRRQAAITLGRIGQPAEPAIPELIEILDRPARAAESAPALWALKGLALFGHSAVAAAPRVIELLRDPQTSIVVRLTSTETLGRIGTESLAGIEALIDGGAGQLTTPVAYDQLELRVACIEALQMPAPASAVPMLVAACADDAERIRHAAASTLGYLGNRGEPAADMLAAMAVTDDNPIVREAAARSLARLGPVGNEVILRMLHHEEDRVRIAALDAASRATKDRERLAHELVGLFDDPSSLVEAQALSAWWELTREAQPILQPLVVLLNDDDRAVRMSASTTLMKMGLSAMPIRAELERMIEPGAAVYQRGATRVLQNLDLLSIAGAGAPQVARP